MFRSRALEEGAQQEMDRMQKSLGASSTPEEAEERRRTAMERAAERLAPPANQVPCE